MNLNLSIKNIIPNFYANATNGDFNLDSYKDNFLVLYFYPKDNTPGCSRESVEFSNASNKFYEYNTIVFGISRDSIESHLKFIKQKDLKIPLISDPNGEICKIFRVLKEKSLFANTAFGIERSTFFIGQNRALLQEWRKVKVPGHVENVLNFAKEVYNGNS